MKQNNPSPKKHLILTLLKTGMLSWLILLSWAIYGWVQHDFSQSLNAIQNLATTQIGLVSSFEHLNRLLSFINQISINLPHTLNPFLLFTIQIWILLCAITHVLAIKLSIIVLSIPLFTLAILAGLVDGLSQRAIRTASLGRESKDVCDAGALVVKPTDITRPITYIFRLKRNDGIPSKLECQSV